MHFKIAKLLHTTKIIIPALRSPKSFRSLLVLCYNDAYSMKVTQSHIVFDQKIVKIN